MIEHELADRFQAAVADEPPIGFDPDDLADRARRTHQRRAVIGASGLAAGTVVLAGVLAVQLVRPGDPAGGLGPAGGGGPCYRPTAPGTTVVTLTDKLPPSRPTAPYPTGSGQPTGPSDDPSVLVPEPTEGPPTTPVPRGAYSSCEPSAEPSDPFGPSESVPESGRSSDVVRYFPVAELSQVISAVLAERVPGLRFSAPDSGELVIDAQRREMGGAYLATGTTHRYLAVWVSHLHNGLDLAADPAAAGGWGPLLSDTVRPDGSHLRVYRFTDGPGVDQGAAEGLLVVHLRVDGVVVRAEASAKPEPGQHGLPAAQDVLTAIATDPRLTF